MKRLQTKKHTVAVMSLCFLINSCIGSGRATYVIPVSDPLLKPYATFNVPVEPFSQDPSHRSVQFVLPSELVGSNASLFNFAQQPDASWSGTSEAGEEVKGKCVTLKRNAECQVSFKGLKIDAADVERVLARTYLGNAEELAARIEVAKRFQGEPEGTLTYKFYETK